MPQAFARLLGAPLLTDAAGSRIESLLAQPKRFAVLAYLLVEANGTPVTRDKVAALFWPELDQQRARQALRQSLLVVRKEVGDDAIDGVGAELLVANPAALTSDVGEFRAAAARGDHETTLAAYRGHFLDGFAVADAPDFEHWADGVRAALRADAVRAASALAEAAEARGDLDGAARWLEAQLRVADIDERALRRLITLLARRGDGASAVAAFDAYAQRMRRELDVDPSPETGALVAQVRSAGVFVESSPRVEPADVGTFVRSAPQPEVLQPAARQPAPAPPHLPPLRVRLSGTILASYALAATVVIAVVAAALWMAFGATRDRPQAAAALPPSVAVLPFLDLSPGGDHGYLSDGLTEELISALSQIKGLRVPARTSSFAYRNARADVPKIGRELRVGAVLEGSVRVEGERVRVTAQLIDATTGYHLWSETFDRTPGGLIAVQDEIARAIARALRVQLVGPSVAVAAAPTAARAAAHIAYLKGRYFWNQRDHDAIATAIDLFREAVGADPTYAAAHAGLASALQLAPNFTVLPPDSAFPLALASVQRALALDPDLAEAHASLGFIKLQWAHDWAGAERELRKAIDLAPGYATAWQWLRLYDVAVGKLDDALVAAREAHDLDPASVSIQCAVGDVFYYQRKFDRARAAYAAALKLDPAFDRALASGARTEMQLGNLTQAITMGEKSVARPPRNARYIGTLAFIYARAGRAADARRMLDSLRVAARRSYVPPYAFVMAHAGFGAADSTLAWIGKAVAERDAFAIELWPYPELAFLAKDARFAALVRRTRQPGH